MNSLTKANVQINICSMCSGEIQAPFWTKTSSGMTRKIDRIVKSLLCSEEDEVEITILVTGKNGKHKEITKGNKEVKQIIKNIFKFTHNEEKIC